jgi:transposase
MNSERKHSHGTYLAAAVPSEVRICMAKVADALLAEGVSYKRQREIYSEAGYEISEPTFRRLRACVHEGLDPLSGAKSSGRPKALTDQQVLIFVGWVLNCNKENEKVDLEGSVRFVEEQFAVCVSKETVRGLLLQNGFSSRKGRRRTGLQV